MYAFGATPERPHVGGWSAPAGAHVFASPAAIPATCVPWNDAFRSTGSVPARPDAGPGNERATITFGDVKFVFPFGKPAGYEKPVAERNGFVGSTPSSTMPILMPSPFAPVVACSTSAPITAGLRFVSIRYVALEYTLRTNPSLTSLASFVNGRATVIPSRTTWYRSWIRACGIARRSTAASRRWAATTRAR